MIGNAAIAGTVEISVMEINIVESQIIAQRVNVHLSHALGIITGFRKFSGHGVTIIPGDSVFIAYPAVMTLLPAGVQCGAGSDTAGAGTVCPVKDNSPGSQGVEIWGFDVWVSGIAQAVCPELICHDKYNVRIWHIVYSFY